MTVTQLAVKKVAIIGAGPGGLVALNELLHTSKDGVSTIKNFNGENSLPEEGAFDDIVVFEQNKDIGGLWNYTDETDPSFPKGVQDICNPSKVRTRLSMPSQSILNNTSVEHPYTQRNQRKENYAWNHNGLYKDLYTNVPREYMRFSSGNPPDEFLDSRFHPFLHHSDVFKYLKRFAERNDLKKYIRFGSAVEKVIKDVSSDKWIIQVGNYDSNTGQEKWYKETFDAVIVAVGRFNVPFFPPIENISKFDEINPNVIQHVKSFRSAENLKNKKVLIVGSSVSAVDITQYLIPVASEVHLALNKSDIKEKDETSGNAARLWISPIINDPSLLLIKHPRIKRFKDKEVEFEDGKIEVFDKIILATGYHIHYPFLDYPENSKLRLVKFTLEKGQNNTALRKVNNLYLFTFSLEDPTLAHIGLAVSPFFFLMAEANSIAIAGIWSNAKSLPPIEEQKEWIDKEFNREVHIFDEEAGANFIKLQYKYAPKDRAELLQLMKTKRLNSKEILTKFYYDNVR